MQEEVERLASWGTGLDDCIGEKDRRIEELQNELCELNRPMNLLKRFLYIVFDKMKAKGSPRKQAS